MSEKKPQTVWHRKLRPRPPANTPERAFQIALARASAAVLDLSAGLVGFRMGEQRPKELAETVADGALNLFLMSGDRTVGVLSCDASLVQAVVRKRTTGRIGKSVDTGRRPSDIDAAMILAFLDRVLSEFSRELSRRGIAFVMPEGLCCGGRIPDRGAIDFELPACPYGVHEFDLSLDSGKASGRLLISWATVPVPNPADRSSTPRATMRKVLGAAPCLLDVILCRRKEKLARIMTFAPGDRIYIPLEALKDVALHSIDGRKVARGKLGQSRGQRAVRVVSASNTPVSAVAPSLLADTPDEELAEQTLQENFPGEMLL